MAAPSRQKLGRNDHCWCGSGMKYKKCHLFQDEEDARRLSPRVPANEPDLPNPPSLSPEEEAERREWEKFEHADFDGKIAFLSDHLEKKRIDAEDVVNAYFDIRDETDLRHDAVARTRLTEFIEHLRRTSPETYRKGIGVYLQDLIQFAVAERRWDALPPLLAEFAEVADEEMVGFSSAVEMLLYHGQTQPLLAAMEALRSKAENITGWGGHEFGGMFLELSLYRYLEETPRPHADDPVLRESIGTAAGKPGEAWLATALHHLNKPAPSPWKVEDFGEAVDAEKWEQNVSALLFEFMAHQWRRASIPLTRSHRFKEELLALLHQQALDHKPKSGAQPPKSKHAPSKMPSSPLVPRSDTLDRGLAAKFRFLASRPYEAGALIELLPAYLHFIARLALIHPAEMDTAFATLKRLGEQILRFLDRYPADIYLLSAVETAWSDAALDALRDDPELSAARAKPVSLPSPTPASAPEPQTYRFKVSYLHAQDVWFIIEMGATQTLDDLHLAIQSAAHFDNDHMYAYFLSGRAWDRATKYGHGDTPYSSRIRVGDLRLRLKQRFLYLFDFGDEHRFNVQLVATSLEPPPHRHPHVVERHGTMPPQYPHWDEEGKEEPEE